MKKRITWVVFIILTLTLTACSKQVETEKPTADISESEEAENESREESSESSETDLPESESESEKPVEESTAEPEEESFSLKPSPDKYTQYIDKFIGMNAATIGYSSLGGDRLIKLGAGLLNVIFVTPDGTYIGPDEEELLKNYVVVAQSYEPNTEVKLEFEKDSDGKEYDNLVSFQTIESIDLLVKEVGSDDPENTLVSVDPSPDKYTYYIRNYIGKNVYSIGYRSLGGDLRDKYGAGTIKLNLVADDGSYIDIEDETILKQYVVTGQNVAANSVMQFVYATDSEGNEYSNLVESQTYDAITLNVKSVTGEPVVSTKETETADEESSKEESSAESGQEESKEEASDDGYENIYNEYKKKIEERAKELLEEYRKDSKDMDLMEKAELCTDNIGILAEIYTEGVEEMAEHMFHGGGADDYDTWAEKLYDVYDEQASVLYTEYEETAF